MTLDSESVVSDRKKFTKSTRSTINWQTKQLNIFLESIFYYKLPSKSSKSYLLHVEL